MDLTTDADVIALNFTYFHVPYVFRCCPALTDSYISMFSFYVIYRYRERKYRPVYAMRPDHT